MADGSVPPNEPIGEGERGERPQAGGPNRGGENPGRAQRPGGEGERPEFSEAVERRYNAFPDEVRTGFEVSGSTDLIKEVLEFNEREHAGEEVPQEDVIDLLDRLSETAPQDPNVAGIWTQLARKYNLLPQQEEQGERSRDPREDEGPEDPSSKFDEAFEESYRSVPDEVKRVLESSGADDDIKDFLRLLSSPETRNLQTPQETQAFEERLQRVRESIYNKAPEGSELRKVLDERSFPTPLGRINVWKLVDPTKNAPEPQEQQEQTTPEAAEEGGKVDDKPANEAQQAARDYASAPTEENLEKLKEKMLPIADEHYLEHLRAEHKGLYYAMIAIILTLSLGAGMQYAFAAAVENAAKQK